jgi:hypothetical protein
MNAFGSASSDAALVITLAYIIQVQSAAWYVIDRCSARSRRRKTGLSGACHRLVGDDAAVDQFDDAVAAGRQARVVGDDQEGGALAAVEFAEQGEDVVGRVGIEVAGRLVGEDQRRGW